MTDRATKRSGTFEKPPYWTDAPVPKPKASEPTEDPQDLNPTRYGDWVKDGIAVDF